MFRYIVLPFENQNSMNCWTFFRYQDATVDALDLFHMITDTEWIQWFFVDDSKYYDDLFTSNSFWENQSWSNMVSLWKLMRLVTIDIQ